MVHETITHGQLEALLLDLGFERQSVERLLPGSDRKQKLFRYEHNDSDTVILLPAEKRTEAVRQTDLVSARLHLVQKGLIDEEELNDLLAEDPARKRKVPTKAKPPEVTG